MNERSSQPDYSRIAASPRFKALMARKIRFIVPITLFFMTFYFLLPVLTSYSKMLNTVAFGAVTWAWIFAFAQFIMTWTLCEVYSRKAVQFDADAEAIKSEVRMESGEVQQ